MRYKGGLVQPVPNRAKHPRRSSDEKSGVSEVGGKRYSLLLGQCGVIAQGYWVCGYPLKHHGHASRLRHPGPFPQIAFFIDYSRSPIIHPPPRTNILAPSLPHTDTWVVTISPGKGSDNLTNASGDILSSGIVVILFSWVFFMP